MTGELRSGLPSIPWHATYLTVVVLSIGLLGTHYLFPQFQHPSGLVIAGLVSGMFTVTSLLHWCDVTNDRFPEQRR